MKTSFAEGKTETGEEGRLAGGWTIAGAMAAITASGGPSPLRSSYKIPPDSWSRFASFKFFAAAYLDDIEPARLAPTHSHGKINVLDPYSLCPCGSGKKFKWCCQPIHVEIEKAFQQDQDGQHEAALRLMEQVVAQHPDNPEAFGKQALLLWQNEKPDEADEALAKAFKIMPDYPFGHFLRGRFRQFEGEIAGALLLYRKAAEVYDPTAQAVLNEIFLSIFDCEMKLNRPVAARAAAMLALKADPNNLQLQKSIDEVFADANPNLPAAAKKAYAYIPTHKLGRAAWDKAMAKINTSRLSDVLRAFTELAKADPEDPNVWFNLGITQAWLGQNAAAIESLEKYIAMESDEKRTTDAGALVEVLRFGQGMEEQSDFVEYAITTQLRDPQSFFQGLGNLEKDRKIAGLSLDREQGILSGFVLGPPAAKVIGGEGDDVAPVTSFFVFAGGMLRLWGTSQDQVSASLTTLREKMPSVFGESLPTRGPAKFHDVFAASLVIPLQPGSQEAQDRIVRDQVAKYFEETWIHQPLKSLGGVAPVDAAASTSHRKKLLGLITFLEQVGGMGGRPSIYDFARLRRKLSLGGEGGTEAGATSAAAPADISAMGAAELSGLPAETFEPAQLELAFQAAISADAKELAGKFARLLVERPTRPDRPDRYPWHNHLVNLAVAEGDYQAAINHLNDGEKDDCENNSGRRRNDFELRRAQILAKSGDHDQADATFARLIDRSPQEWKYRGAAAEAFLSARQGERAMKFAESAVAEAKKVNNRDQEGYFQELLEAAKRQR
jgi:tetratricopeptide (TPR) repeat protein